MSRNVILVLAVALLLGGALAWVLLGEGGFGSGGDLPADTPDALESHDARSADSRVGGKDGRASAGQGSGAVLFGRPRGEQVGRGGLRGRVAHANEARGIAGAKVMLVGVGFGEEEVASSVTSSDNGTFRLTDVPAGDAYVLRVQAEGAPDRALRGLSIRRGSETDLGDVWMGADVVFEGEVVDSLGRGVGGAQVRLHAGHLDWSDMLGQITEMFAELDRDPEAMAEVRTRADGRFAFPGVSPGPVTMVVHAAGYAPGSLQTVITAPNAATRRVRIHLEDGARIAGRVVDGRGRGISGARVAIINGNDPSAFVFGRTFTDTDANGAFWIDTAKSGEQTQLLATYPGYPVAMKDVDPGTEDVELVVRGGSTLVVRILGGQVQRPVGGAQVLAGVRSEKGMAPTTLGTGTTDASGRVEIPLRPGTIEMILVTHPDHASAMWSAEAATMGLIPGLMKGPSDATLSEGLREITLEYGQTIQVEGTVTDLASGTPIGGARVVSMGGFQSGRPTRTDAGGHYTLHVTKSPMSVIVVEASGYVRRSAGDELAFDEVKDGVLTHDVQMKRGAVVSGRVVDARGHPIGGAQIRAEVSETAHPLHFSPYLSEPNATVSSGNGAFILDGVERAESVRLFARRSGYVDGASPVFSTMGENAARKTTIVLKDGFDLEILVVDPTGLPVAGARVNLDYGREDGVSFDGFTFVGSSSVSTDQDGTVRREHVPTCTLTATAVHPAWAAGTVTALVGKDVAMPLRIRVELQRARTVRGRVLDTSGKPLAGAQIWVHDGVASRTTATDADGTFELTVREQGVAIQVNAGSYQGKEVDVPAGQNKIEIRLEAQDVAWKLKQEAMQTRIREISKRLETATSDEEREALEAEMETVFADMAGSPASPIESVPADDDAPVMPTPADGAEPDPFAPPEED